MQQYADSRYTADIHTTFVREPLSFETDHFGSALKYIGGPGEGLDYSVIVDNVSGRTVLRRSSFDNWSRERGALV